MYDFYIDGLLLPETPSKLTIKTPDRNQTADLISGDVMSILKSPGLRTVIFDAWLSYEERPFTSGRYKSPRTVLDKIESLKNNSSYFQFIVVRRNTRGNRLDDTNIKVSIADYTSDEDSANGSDFKISLQLQEYRSFSTKTIRLSNGSGVVSTNSNTNRWETTGIPKTYTVQRGDTIQNIGRTFYNNGNAYKQIMIDNKISNPNSIYAGQVLALPEYFGVIVNA